jgi:Na+-translocating ferredoxin:NAD+ oxidoreductase RnfG subunit
MRARRAVLLLLVVAGACGPLAARVYMTQDEALRLAFPDPESRERRTLYLDDAQAQKAAAEAGAPVEARVVPYYIGRSGNAVTGYAFFDTHLVRTLPETIMIRLTPAGAIAAIDILSFDEPEDYKVNPRWLEQFKGRQSDETARLPAGIRAMTGATLSAQAITDAARRVLALYHLYVERPSAPAPTGAP